MRHVLIVLLVFVVSPAYVTLGQQPEVIHYVCIQSSNTYHDKSSCASLQLCSGGKIRRTKNTERLKPCPKCARPVVHTGSKFSNIKNVLGVKNKKQIADSLGTDEAVIRRPNGLTIRISGPPESKTVNTLEFFFKDPVPFNEDSLFSAASFRRLGLQFDGCRADTIRNTTAHPVTGKTKKDVAIEYRGCANVEPRDQYEDTSKYFYELSFISKDTEAGTYVDKIQLLLKVDRP